MKFVILLYFSFDLISGETILCKFSNIRRRRDANLMQIRFWSGKILEDSVEFDEILWREKNPDSEYIEDLEPDSELRITSRLHNLQSEYYIVSLIVFILICSIIRLVI